MKWLLPAKTFLLGEYAAIAQGSAIVLTTEPYFRVSLTNQVGLDGIHPESPAGLWWQQKKYTDFGLTWHDPYQGCGGLGASSAQFLGSYLASCYLQNILPRLNSMLNAYYHHAWSGKGLKPSGYDVISQAHQACVFINKEKGMIQSYSWPFKDLSFLLIHTGIKLATHHHLQNTPLPAETMELSKIVELARVAIIHEDSNKMIDAVNQYHNKLTKLNLVAEHSLKLIKELKNLPEILAIKGCGALGADVLLLMTHKNDSAALKNKLIQKHYLILATERDITPLKSSYFN